MAFSYSDKNFTVIGNLCFVHIFLDGTETVFDIPPAISDRMLINDFVFPYIDRNNGEHGIGLALIYNGKISCTSSADNSYIMFFFPIDSNK